MEYKVESGSSSVRKFLDSMMPSIVEQLGLSNSRKAVLVKVTDEILDADKNFSGSTLNLEFADCYLVLIKKPGRVTKEKLLDIGLTLCHEMVHVKQLAKGQLKFLPDSKRYWLGKTYSQGTKYLDQPWELEAFSRQEIVFRRAIETNE